MAKFIKLFMSLSVSFLTACSQSGSVEDASKILVLVNGEAITENQLLLNVDALFGEGKALDKLPIVERKKILESMVISRLIKQEAIKGFDDMQINMYQQKSNIYKEKLIVNHYLKENIKSSPITNEMVVSYYNKHPEKYGAETVIKYELLTAIQKINELDRDKLLSVYSKYAKQRNLKVLQKNMLSDGVDLVYRQGRLNKGVIDEKIEKLIESIDVGEVSSLVMHNGRPYIVKTIDKKYIPPKSLSSVSDEIRKQLAPVALKKSIKQQSEKLKVLAKIEYLNK